MSYLLYDILPRFSETKADRTTLPVHPGVAEEGKSSTNLTNFRSLWLCIHHTNTESNRWSLGWDELVLSTLNYVPFTESAWTLYSELLAPLYGVKFFQQSSRTVPEVHQNFTLQLVRSESNYLCSSRIEALHTKQYKSPGLPSITPSAKHARLTELLILD